MQGFSFEAGPGDHVILKGESGSGKSTILKLLLGFLKPDAGAIRLPDFRKDIRRYTAWLPQDLDLGEGTVQQTIGHLFKFQANRKNAPSTADQLSALQKLGLEREMYTKAFRDLSTGQRQRVGLAICRLLDKPVLLLDEPTSALDLASKKKAAELLLDGDTDNIIISTSHDPVWLERATKIVEVH